MISPGTRLGNYEILGPLGAGGMGEVFRARDTKLGRDVALKVLPAAFTIDAERVSRFKREAQVLASLNHTHIAAIYGFETADNVQFLVLELVEGDTLAKKIARGPMPVKEALAVARQIAEALDAAHEKGIIHRDLKPSNIAFTPDDHVKVLDFGLAKALDPPDSAIDATHSPTITFGATRAGVILGTAAYMSPEQAKGRAADKRSDVWAFGAVLFEMITGRRAFEGEDVSDTLAAVLRGEPDWTLLPADLPPSLNALIRGCLQKDRQARIADISVVRFLLGDPMGTSLTAVSAPVMAAPIQRAAPRAIVAWGAAGVLAAALVSVLVFWAPWRHQTTGQVVRVHTELGSDASLATALGANAVLSPDGKVLAFVGSRTLSDPAVIYIRRLDQLLASPLAGTDRASNPFFSPDGQWIGFFALGKLKKVAVSGGAVVTLCDAPNGRGGAWGEDGTIVFQPDAAAETQLMRVPSAGGAPEKLGALAAGEAIQRWPQVLPSSAGVLYTSLAASAGGFETADIVVVSAKGQRKVVQRGGYYGRYVNSGHLLYMHQGTLFAAPFDLDRLEVTGPAAPAIEAVASTVQNGGSQFAVSDTGTVVYLPGRSITNASPIEWLDHMGKTTSLRAMPSDWSNPAFSPDGRQIAVDISDGSQADVWTYDWSRDTLTRLTFDTSDDQRPVWSPDGARIAFASRRGDKNAFNLYWQRADGTGEVQRLTDSKNNQFATSFHPSGKFLAFFEQAGNNVDLMILPLEGSEAAGWKPGKPTAFLSAPYGESSGMFSPDGKWIAYLSNESGRNELFVRPFPGPGGKWQISDGGADDPSWSARKPELLYAAISDQRIMVLPYAVEGASFRAGKPAVWSQTPIAARPRQPSRDIDLHPDGERFAIAPSAIDTLGKQDKVVFVFNFFDELRRIAPAK